MKRAFQPHGGTRVARTFRTVLVMLSCSCLAASAGAQVGLLENDAESNVVGFELVELNPLVDPCHYLTANNTNRVVRECLTGIAMLKKGFTDKNYLSPLTKSHGQP